MQVNYYAKAKDWILRGWIEICKKVHKGKRSGVTFVDLYAGDGICECELPTGEVEKWPGSAIRAAMAGSSGEAEISVIVNEKDKKIFKSLEKSLQEYESCVKSKFNGDARDVIDEILGCLDPAGHNFFFVDPFGHSDVNMNLLSKIARFGEKRQKYQDVWYTRRPEMLFNFPSSGMARCIGTHAESSIDEFFGHHEWAEFIEKRKNKFGDHAHYSLTLQVLSDMSYYVPGFEAKKREQFPFEVVNQQTKANMYWLLMFASHPLARRIYPSFLGYAHKFFEMDVLGKWVEVREIAKARQKGIKTLDNW